MKRILVIALSLTCLAIQAQKNVFLDQTFWKTNPDIATIQAEIAKGNNPSESNPMAFDAVVYAINAGASTDAIKLLLQQKGNDVNKPTHDGRTYLFWAASRGNTEVMDYLISKGAKVNLEDTHGTTPLSFAATSGQTNTKVYDLLLNAGADVKQKNVAGASLLLLAIANDKDLTLTNYFISKGLSLHDVDATGNTAFNYVARTGNIDLMKTLVEKGVKYNDNAMIMATQGGRGGPANGLPVFQYLESLKLKPTAVNSNGENVLHNLVRRPGGAELIGYCISKGVSVNQADKEGNTPFMNAAATNRDTATIALLLPSVKNINQVNGKGISALDVAIRSNSADVVRMLIQHGADMNGYDASGNNLAWYLIQSYTAPAGQRQSGGGGERPGGNGQAGGNGEGNRIGGGERGGFGGPRVDDFTAKMKVLQENGYNLTTPQKDGNTLYHLALLKNDLPLLEKLGKLSIDVNAKNKEGLTPLHKAAMLSKDDTELKYLLSIGDKKDITTDFKETAFDLAKENEALSKNGVSVDFLK